jgi:hypothetical protein
LASACLTGFEPRRPQRFLDRSPLSARRGTWGELVEVADLGLGLPDGVVGRGLLVECRQGALLTCPRRTCAARHGVEHGLYWGRGCRGPMGEGRLGVDQSVDLFQFDDVRPVGDDPVPSTLLSGGRRDEMLVDFCRADVAGGEMLDKSLFCSIRGSVSAWEDGWVAAEREEGEGGREHLSCSEHISVHLRGRRWTSTEAPAEREGFEPSDPCGSSAFKAGAIVHSATVPPIRLTSGRAGHDR